MIKEDISKIILGTGSYHTVKSGNTVSVSGDGGNTCGYYGSAYKKLAPRLITYSTYIEKYKELLKMKGDSSRFREYISYRKEIEDEYIRSYYETILSNLDIEELLYSLESRFGSGVIFLCYERVIEFCHRRLIADYIELKTGVYIPELRVNFDGKIKKLIPIRYKNRLKKLM